MKKVTLLASLALSIGALNMQGQTSCNDLNGYPQSKNTGGTGAYTLTYGQTENAAQTYHYSGPGKITGIRVYGYTPNWAAGVGLDVKVYHVDASGRPTSTIGTRHITWHWDDNLLGFKDVSFYNGGYALNSDFAVGIEMTSGITSVTQFQVTYTGDGEGRGEDLISLGGTSTGNNWVSGKNNYAKDGDFYILPRMKHFITADINAPATCISTGSPVSFTNNTQMTTDSMFNQIALSGYTGSNHLYTWDFGDGSALSYAKNPTHTYVTPGQYTVTLTSEVDGWNGNCSNTFTHAISVGLSAGSPVVTNVTCNGGKTGSFTVSATGGATPYTYSIDDDSYGASPTFVALNAGSYTVYVKDALGCVQTSAVTISQPAPIVFSPATTTYASCNNSDGGIQAQATGGSGTLQYSLNGVNWQSSGTFTSLTAGAYTVWTKDGNGCTASLGVPVNNLGGPSLTISSSTNASCSGLSNGTIVASATGGSGVLQYSINGVNFQSTGSFNGLPADTFFVTVKDAAGCMDIETVVINEPPHLNFKVTSSPVSCYNGSDGTVSVTNVTGGTGTMSYAIGGMPYQSGNVFTGLTSGGYLVNVKDAAGCVTTKSIVIMQPTQIASTLSSGNPSCNGSADGYINIVASGGTPRFTYSLDGTNFYPTGDFSELSAGTYTVLITDAHGCTKTVTASIAQPSILTSTITIGKSTCGNANGNILIAAGGGSGSGYQYSIDGNNWNSTGSFVNLTDSTYEILVKDGSGCDEVFPAIITNSNGPVINSVSSTNITCHGSNNGSINVTSVTGGSGTLQYQVAGLPWQTSTAFTNLPAGVQTVVVADGLGCTGSYSVMLTEPAAIVVNTSVTNLACSGAANGSATVTAGGGSGTLAYSINGVVFQSNNQFTNLAPGNYLAYVRDAGGCLASNNFTITSPLPIAIIGLGTLDVNCHGAANGALNIIAAGGTAPFEFSLDGINYQASGSFSGLNGGNYTVFIKDVNGCIKTGTAVINEPTAIAASTNITNVSCYGGHNGSIQVNASGGTPAFTFNWSNQLGTNSYVGNLYPGTYSVTITDENGCSKIVSSTIAQPSSPLIVNATVNNASGNSTADGSIVATVTGGTAPYTFYWSNGVTTQNNYNIQPGSYIVTITDANGCVTSGVFTVGVATGISSITVNNTVKLYPNPASNYITLESDNLKIDEVEMFNLVGDVLYKSKPADLKVSINIDNLNDGMYFVRYKVNNQYTTRRVEILK